MPASPSRSERHDDRVALVTGGSRGIGRAVVEALLGDGWTVFFCSRSPDSVERALSRLRADAASRVHGRTCDVRNSDEVDDLVDWVLRKAGRIDCLVNNAGLGVFAPIDQLTPDEWRLVLRTNLDGCYYAIRAVAPSMKERADGWIINIASLASRTSIAGGAAYNASKFGLLGLSDAAMLDLRPHGVRVAAILPGSVDTDFSSPSSGESWKLQPEDVARAVADLLRYPDRALPSRIELRPTQVPQH